MKILQVVEPGKDGVFRHIEDLTDYLIRGGHEVSLAYSDVRSSDALFKLVDRVKAAGGETVNMSISNLPHPDDMGAFSKICAIIDKTKPQVIHGHSSKAGALLRFAALRKGVPAFYTPHAYWGMANKGGAKELFFNSVEKVLGNIGVTINVSEDEAAFARKVLKIRAKKQAVIPNAIDFELFRPGTEDERQEWRVAHNLPADAILLGTLARLSYQKDPLTLYRAFQEVAVRNPKVYLVHLGSGELTEECAALATQLGLDGRIIRIKHTSTPATFYRSLDGFILSSRYEGLSISVLEALASGLPLILTDVPGNRDFLSLKLSHAWSGPAGEPKVFGEAISRWVDDISNKRANNHRETAYEKFSFDVCFGKIVTLYESSSKPGRSR